VFKIIKRLFIFILVILVLALGATLIFLNSVKVNITEDDLPDEVYDTTDSLDTMIQDKMIEIASSPEDQTNALFEDFLNLMIYQTIKDNVNPEYDPINGDTEQSQYIVNHNQFTLDYVIAEMTEDDQVRITVSIKRGSFPSVSTAFYFLFDMEIIRSTMTFRLTLDKVYLDDNEIQHRVYDYFVSLADKDQVESQIDRGTLDLDDYTYEVSFADFIPSL